MAPLGEFTIYCGDCRDILPTLPTLADACICDPPYGLKFMGKGWDHGVPGPDFWKAILDACKPGTHLLAFGGTRTFHRLGCAIEDAGWEIRDTLMWVYGSGFPKSLDVSKAIDTAAGAPRKVVSISKHGSGANQTKLANHGPGDTGIGYMDGSGKTFEITAPATDAAKQWQGWGTALKPAWEPIFLARKPLDGTVAANVQQHGTGALNIDGCRVETNPDVDDMLREVTRQPRQSQTWAEGSGFKNETNPRTGVPPQGRWPANLIHDGSPEVLACFPAQAGAAAPVKGSEPSPQHKSCYSPRDRAPGSFFNDSGSAARFFYCSKASPQDRDEGCESIPAVQSGMSNGAQLHGEGYSKGQDIGLNRVIERRNFHPTVKPTALMRYLVKLVSRRGATILDPFMGSGSTGKAAILEGRTFSGIELSQEYIPIANARLSHAVKMWKESSKQQQLPNLL